jgi:hypothetical protein
MLWNGVPARPKVETNRRAAGPGDGLGMARSALLPALLWRGWGRVEQNRARSV